MILFFYWKMLPKWPPNGSQNRLKIDLGATLSPPWAPRWAQDAQGQPPGPNLDDLGSISYRFWIEIWPISDWNLIDFESNLCWNLGSILEFRASATESGSKYALLLKKCYAKIWGLLRNPRLQQLSPWGQMSKALGLRAEGFISEGCRL